MKFESKGSWVTLGWLAMAAAGLLACGRTAPEGEDENGKTATETGGDAGGTGTEGEGVPGDTSGTTVPAPVRLFSGKRILDFAVGGEKVFVTTLGTEGDTWGSVRACDEATCTSDETVAAFPRGPGLEVQEVRKVAVNDGWLYWLDEHRGHGHQKLYASRLNGSEKRAFADLGDATEVGQLVPDGNTLVMSTTGHGLLRVLRDETAGVPYGLAKVNVDVGSSGRAAVATSPSHVAFWYPEAKGPAPVQVEPRAPGPRLTVGLSTEVPAHGLVLSSNAVFWVSGEAAERKLYACSLVAPCTEPKVVASQVAPAVTTDGRRVYFAGPTTHAGERVPAFQSCGIEEAVAGGCTPLVQLGGLSDAVKLQVSEKHIYGLSAEGFFTRAARPGATQ